MENSEAEKMAYFWIEVKRCFPSIQTRRSVPSGDWDTAERTNEHHT
jgi:hypothetical protein